MTSANNVCIKIIHLGCEICRIKCFRIMDLKVCNFYRHCNISNCMSLGEHIFYSIAGIYIPPGNILRFHGLLILFPETLALTDPFHYIKGSFLFYSHLNQVCHYIVTGGYNSADFSMSLFYYILGIVNPYVSSVGKSAYSNQI